MRSTSIIAFALVAAAAPGLSAPLRHPRQDTGSIDQSGAANISKYTTIAKDLAEGATAIQGAIQGGVDIFHNIKNGRREDDVNQSGAINSGALSTIMKDVSEGVNAIEGAVQGGVDIYHNLVNNVNNVVRDDTVDFSSFLARYHDARDASADQSGALDFDILRSAATDVIDAGEAIGRVISGGKAIYESIKNGHQQQQEPTEQLQERDMHALLARAILNNMVRRALNELD